MTNIVGKNGTLNGIFATSTLLGEDIFFFNPGEISYDGENHVIRGIQLNEEKVHMIPNLMDNAQMLAEGLIDCMNEVEENDKLKCDLSDIDSELYSYINNENLTGITLMHLFAWHLLKIVEGNVIGTGDSPKKNTDRSVNKVDYTIIGDIRVLNGIPNSQDMIDELIHTLLRYNDDDKEIAVEYIRIRNFDI